MSNNIGNTMESGKQAFFLVLNDFKKTIALDISIVNFQKININILILILLFVFNF